MSKILHERQEGIYIVVSYEIEFKAKRTKWNIEG